MNNVSAPVPRRTSLLQRHKSVLRPAQIVIDILLTVAVLLVLAYVKDGEVTEVYRVQAVITTLLMLGFYSYFGVYHFHTSRLRAVIRLTKAWGLVIFCLFLIGFVTKTSGVFSRQVILSWMVVGYFAQLLAHLLVPSILKLANVHAHRARKHALIIGAGALGKYLAEGINSNPWLYVKIVGVVDDDATATQEWSLREVPVVGKIDELKNLVDEHQIVSVYITLPLRSSAAIARIHAALEEKNVNVYWAPDIHGLALINPSVREMAGLPVMALSETPLLGSHKWLKVTEDTVLAGLALIVLTPLLALVSLLVKLDSPGPVIFKQRRHGWEGEIIDVWKFRTMYVEASQDGQVKQATREDPRVTRVGAILRRTSIDELPQLFNVLRGDMSIVGPRPHAIEHNHYYTRKIDAYLARHRIKPGMTGLAQVEGFRGETESLEKMESRVAYDLKYINNWSLWLDLWIMLRTFPSLFNKNVY